MEKYLPVVVSCGSQKQSASTASSASGALTHFMSNSVLSLGTADALRSKLLLAHEKHAADLLCCVHYRNMDCLPSMIAEKARACSALHSDLDELERKQHLNRYR